LTAVYDIPKNVTAYIIYKLLKLEIIITPTGDRERRMYRAKHYNCNGKYYRGHDSFLWDGETVPEGVMVDMRNLQLLKWGCCPKGLAAEMLGAVEPYEEEGAEIEEAALLHKKGYLGGI